MPKIKFEPLGIGDLIRQGRLVVPPNQRSYAWEERNVRELLQDLNGEMNKDKTKGAQEYFLGTIVLVETEDDTSPPQISDGQQRIATTSIILARIRDILRELGNEQRASAIQGEYLSKVDFDSGENKPQLRLNAEDNEYYSNTILGIYPHEPETVALRSSNKRLRIASETAYDFLKKAVSGFADDLKVQQLRKWVNFIKSNTHVVAVRVPNENDAFRLFETLNDRGVKASQVDILKNYFLQTSGSLMQQTHSAWTELSGKIEAHFPDDNDQMILYLRHLWITKHGHTIEKELSKKIREKLQSETTAVSFVHEANAASSDYIALSEPSSPTWNSYPSTTREYLNTISTHLKVEQIKPLLFAIARFFSPVEADKAFRLCVSMSVRFLIFGGRGGFLDEHYASRAHDIGAGKIAKASELRQSLIPVIPTDAQFENAFAAARVSKQYLARYYLRIIDKTINEKIYEEFVAVEDYNKSNLEHIIPLTLPPNSDLAKEEAASVQNMIGNMTLINTKKNGELANLDFAAKKKVYKYSFYKITSALEKYEKFGPTEVKQRQEELAALAVKAWTLKFD